MQKEDFPPGSYQPAVRLIAEALALRISHMTSAIMSRAGLSKSYGPVKAVVNVDLDVRRGEIYGFLGRNGAGKTTTIRMLLGLVRPSAGEISILGSSLAENRAASSPASATSSSRRRRTPTSRSGRTSTSSGA